MPSRLTSNPIVLTLALLLLSSLPHFCQSDPAGTLISSKAVAYNPATGKTYIADATHNKVWIVNARAHTTVGLDAKGPSSVAINQTTGRVYAVLAAEHALVVIDANSDRILSKLNAGPHPYNLAIDERLNRVYVSNTFSDIVSVVHGDTNAVDSLHLGSEDDLLVDGKTSHLFLISYEDPNLKIFDPTTGRVDKVEIGEHVWALDLSKETGTVYVTRVGAAQLVAIDERTHEKRVATVGAIPCALGLDEAAHRLFVVNYGDGTVTTLDTTSLQTLATAQVGSRPQSIVVSPEQHSIYIASAHRGTIERMDERTGTVNGKSAEIHSVFGIGLSAQPEVPITGTFEDPGWAEVLIR